MHTNVYICTSKHACTHMHPCAHTHIHRDRTYVQIAPLPLPPLGSLTSPDGHRPQPKCSPTTHCGAHGPSSYHWQGPLGWLRLWAGHTLQLCQPRAGQAPGTQSHGEKSRGSRAWRLPVQPQGSTLGFVPPPQCSAAAGVSRAPQGEALALLSSAHPTQDQSRTGTPCCWLRQCLGSTAVPKQREGRGREDTPTCPSTRSQEQPHPRRPSASNTPDPPGTEPTPAPGSQRSAPCPLAPTPALSALPLHYNGFYSKDISSQEGLAGPAVAITYWISRPQLHGPSSPSIYLCRQLHLFLLTC